MLRFFLFVAAITGVSLGASWFLDRPGEVRIVWQGTQYETSLMVLLVAVLVIVIALFILWAILRSIFSIPTAVSNFFEGRRHARGMRAIARGLVAIGLGDVKSAQLASQEAGRLIGSDPLTLLLSAHTAQLQGDKVQTERALRAMLEKPDTRPLGLRGLFVEARRQGRIQEALRFADEAARVTPDAAWAAHALLEIHVAMHDWDSALRALERGTAGKAIDRTHSKRLRAVLLTGKALHLAASDRDSARYAALEAIKNAPDLVPAITLAGRFLAETDHVRRANRLLLKAWQACPHPDIAEVYVHLRPADNAQERLKRALKLAEYAPPHNAVAAQAVANAALDARDFGLARTTLEPFLPQATRSMCLFMADLDELEFSDYGRSRQWLARAVTAPPDAAWVADTLVSETWLPASPVTGQLDVFEWKTPPESLRSAKVIASAPLSDSAALPEIPEPLPSPAAATELAANTNGKALLPPEPHEPFGHILPQIPVPDDPGPLALPDDGTPSRKGAAAVTGS